ADLRIASTVAATVMTHVAPICIASGLAVAEAVAASVRGEDPFAAAQAATWDEAIARALDEVERGWSPGGEAWSGHGRSHPLKTVKSALWAVRRDRPAEEVLLDLVHRGGDADTHAAVAGALLGARDGIEALPGRWRAALQVGPLLSGIAQRFERSRSGSPPNGP
ncbi:MAG: hypothetical protein GF346_09705, partial [Candidatus Eisenbacteria bacterium]|nr:hypothetical protein [Candidatus Latescibacterota bacterium]MBD3302708.1 hypothetical protein [Candidatus Eisenbacteria bacterium]